MSKSILPHLTEDDLDQIEKLAMYGLEISKIAHVFNLPVSKFKKILEDDARLQIAIDRGYAKAEAEVSRTAFEMASSGQSASMTQFWLKCRAKWKEVQVIEARQTTIEDLVHGASGVEDNVISIKKAD